MPNTYSWEVQDMIVDPLESGLTNVVKRVVAVYTASDGLGHSTNQLISVSLPAPNPGSFIPYASLTPADVGGWIETQLGGSLATWRTTLDQRLYELVEYQSMECPWE